MTDSSSEVHTEAEAQSDPPQDSAIPRPELDRALSPLRRMAVWASNRPQSGRQLRFAEAAVTRWTAAARALELPAALVEMLDEANAEFQGFDDASPDERVEKMSVLLQRIRRIDALVGLPLGRNRVRIPPGKPRFPDWNVPEEADPVKPESKPVESKKTGRGQDASPTGDSADPVAAEPGSGAEEEAPAPAQAPSRSEQLLALREQILGRIPSPEEEDLDAPLVKPVRPPRGAKKKGGASKEQGACMLWDGRERTPLGELGLPVAWVEALAEAGFDTVGQFLLVSPTGCEQVKSIHGAGRPIKAGRHAVGGRIVTRFSRLGPDGTLSHHLQIKGSDLLEVRYDGGAVALAALGGMMRLPVGDRVILWGDCEVGEGGTVTLINPERVEGDGQQGVGIRSYDIPGLDDTVVRGLLMQCLGTLQGIRDPLPNAVLKRNKLIPRREALLDLHQRDVTSGRQRLAFDEALLLQMGLAVSRYSGGRERGIQVPVQHKLAVTMAEQSELFLNDSQQSVFEDIKRDLRRRQPMRRVLTGPLGSGRGRVALLAAATVAEGKVQVMHVCSDRAMAEQRYLFAAPRLREAGLVARFVSGVPGRAIRDGIERGEIHVLYGTFEMLESEVTFRRLGLIIAEEAENLGRASSMVAAWKAPWPDLLVLPSLPVGALATLRAYPDHDISYIDAPAARSPVRSVHPSSARKGVYLGTLEPIQSNQQVLVLFPVLNGADALELAQAWQFVRALEEEVFTNAKVGLFHGSMKRDERVRAYESFRQRRIDVLVATVAIEDAPDAPEASIVIVEQADRVDTQRLMRIQGLLLRSKRTGRMYLVSGSDETDTLQAQVEGPLADLEGLDTSEAQTPEMLWDGVGEAPMLRWVQPTEDRHLVWSARQQAHRILASDPRLRDGWAADLGRLIQDYWGDWFEETPAPELARGPRRERRRRRRRRKR